MSCGMLEVNPRTGPFDADFGTGKALRPVLEKIDGFVDNSRYASLARPGWRFCSSSSRVQADHPRA